MKKDKLFFHAALLTILALGIFWLCHQTMAPRTVSGAVSVNPSSGADADSPGRNHQSPQNDAAAASSDVLSALMTACQTLAQSTALKDGSADSSGKTLPEQFTAYLADPNGGYDRFVKELSADDMTAFKNLRESIEVIGPVKFVEFVAKNGGSGPPSFFDFVLYSSTKDIIREYPFSSQSAESDIERQWQMLSQNRNPVFRLLGIEEARHVIKDKTALLELLKTRTNEIDPVIVHALIDQFSMIGGSPGKEAIAQIAASAEKRGDQKISKAATDEISKMK